MPGTGTGGVPEDGYKLYLVLSTPNSCLGEGEERLNLFKKGVLTQSFFHELRERGVVLEQQNLVVLCVGRAAEPPPEAPHRAGWEMPCLTLADGEQAGQHLVAFVPPTRQDCIHWHTATHGRLFPPSSVLVMMRLQFAPEDLPVGCTMSDYLNTAVKTLNSSLLNEESTLHHDLCPQGQLEVLLPLPTTRDLPDHENYRCSVDYQAKMSDTQRKRDASHVAMVSTLHELRKVQTAMLQALRAGHDWRDYRDAYLQVEGEMLQVAKQDLETQSHCMSEEKHLTAASLVRARTKPRVVAKDPIDALSAAHTPLLGLKVWEYALLPSEQQSILRSTHGSVSIPAMARKGGESSRSVVLDPDG